MEYKTSTEYGKYIYFTQALNLLNQGKTVESMATEKRFKILEGKIKEQGFFDRHTDIWIDVTFDLIELEANFCELLFQN
jgi:hypothetical protein